MVLPCPEILCCDHWKRTASHGPNLSTTACIYATLKPAHVFTFAWMIGFGQVLSIVYRVFGSWCSERVRELMLRAVVPVPEERNQYRKRARLESEGKEHECQHTEACAIGRKRAECPTIVIMKVAQKNCSGDECNGSRSQGRNDCEG